MKVNIEWLPFKHLRRKNCYIIELESKYLRKNQKMDTQSYLNYIYHSQEKMMENEKGSFVPCRNGKDYLVCHLVACQQTKRYLYKETTWALSLGEAKFQQNRLMVQSVVALLNCISICITWIDSVLAKLSITSSESLTEGMKFIEKIPTLSEVAQFLAAILIIIL